MAHPFALRKARLKAAKKKATSHSISIELDEKEWGGVEMRKQALLKAMLQRKKGEQADFAVERVVSQKNSRSTESLAIIFGSCQI